LCSKMVIDGTAYACMSDDMDLFMYGCPRILKRLDLLSTTVDYYDLDSILKTLNVSFKDFKQICVLSGTDYNKKTSTIPIKNAFKLFSAYECAVKNNKATPNSFYYYINNTVKNANINYKNLLSIIEMFDLSKVNIPNKIVSNYSFKNIDSADFEEKLNKVLTL